MRQFETVIHAVRLLCTALAGLLGYPLPESYVAITAVDTTGPPLDGLLRRSLRQQAFGGGLLLERNPVAGLLRMAVGYAVVVVGAKASAAAAARGAAAPPDFDQAHLLARRVLRSVPMGAHFIEHAERVWDILAALPLLASARPPE